MMIFEVSTKYKEECFKLELRILGRISREWHDLNKKTDFDAVFFLDLY